MVPKYLAASSLAMQRASTEAAAALMSSGNSRNTKRTLPASTYFDCSIGNTFSWNAAQCGQLIEAYSTMVTGAFALRSEFPKHEAHLAGVDIFRLQHRKHVLVECGAVRTAH